MNATHYGWMTVCFFLALAAGGCGGAPEKTHPVRGVVRLDGKPLSFGTVLFVSEGQEGRPSRTARGTIGPDGAYTLSTFSPDDGAVAGRHRVAVLVSSLSPPEMEGGSPKPLAPARYAAAETSGLEREVRAGPNQIDLDLTSGG